MVAGSATSAAAVNSWVVSLTMNGKVQEVIVNGKTEGEALRAYAQMGRSTDSVVAVRPVG